MNLWRALREAVGGGLLREVDYHFARTLADIAGEENGAVLAAAALVSRAGGDGHVCVDLAAWAGTPLWEAVETPPLEAWVAALRASPLVGEPGGELAPLVLDPGNRLYLARYFNFERRVAAEIGTRLESLPMPDPAAVRLALDRYFPDPADAQRLAAAVTLSRRFAAVVGGPGTGKTHTVARILALTVELADRPPRIALAAPTGKAAARLGESVRRAKQTLPCPDAVGRAIPEEAATLHRLLGYRPEGGFRHGPDDPLHLELLVLDEASMVDVALMARLLSALPPSARVILLGDRDQLASVEAGGVLGDICNRGGPIGYSDEARALFEQFGCEVPPNPAGAAAGPLADALAVLTRSRRFEAGSGIGALARAVNGGDAAAAIACMQGDDARWSEVNLSNLEGAVGEAAVAGWRACLTAPDPAAALEALPGFVFLCALRDGPFGVGAVNRMAERALARAGLIRTGDRHLADRGHYAGRPVMIARNDYNVGLFNGDVGLILPDPEGAGRLRAFFRGAGGELRRIPLNRLPPHETAYAVTVHKSQGSEYGHCVVVLPDQDAPVLTRELIYTAVTRARSQVAIWGAAPVFAAAVTRRVRRVSGLWEALWGSGSE